MPDIPTRLKYEVFGAHTATSDSEYRVEAIDAKGDGQVYVATFSGPDAKTRAVEYLASVWRIRDLLWSSLCEVTPFGTDPDAAKPRAITTRLSSGDAPRLLNGDARRMNGNLHATAPH